MTQESFNNLHYCVSDRVATITLATPDGKNRLSAQMMSEAASAIKQANSAEDIGCILITAKGRLFSAGINMEEVLLPKVIGKEAYIENDPFTGGLGIFDEDWTALLRNSKPIVVAFNGPAIGGGITVFLAADVLIASEDASFSFPFVKLGAVPEACSTKYLPTRVGFGRASEILLSGRSVDSKEAEKIGLIDHLVPAQQLLTRATDIASSIASTPTTMTTLTKQLLSDNCMEQDTSQVWRRESDALKACFESSDFDAVIKKMRP